jgi:hypothetical protein
MSLAVATRVRIPKPAARPAQQPEDYDTLKAICVVLQAMAQKHLPRDAFSDRASLVQCLKLLTELEVNVAVKSELQAEYIAPTVDTNTLAYRFLRNKTVAALSTIADLDKKVLDRMTSDYHNGMRDAYKKASSIAVAFLADIHGESVEQYSCVD